MRSLLRPPLALLQRGGLARVRSLMRPLLAPRRRGGLAHVLPLLRPLLAPRRRGGLAGVLARPLIAVLHGAIIILPAGGTARPRGGVVLLTAGNLQTDPLVSAGFAIRVRHTPVRLIKTAGFVGLELSVPAGTTPGTPASAAVMTLRLVLPLGGAKRGMSLAMIGPYVALVRSRSRRFPTPGLGLLGSVGGGHPS